MKGGASPVPCVGMQLLAKCMRRVRQGAPTTDPPPSGAGRSEATRGGRLAWAVRRRCRERRAGLRARARTEHTTSLANTRSATASTRRPGFSVSSVSPVSIQKTSASCGRTLPGLAATSCRPFLILQAVQLLSISSETPGLLAHACHARCPLQPGLAHLSAVPQQPFALLGPAGTAAYITEPRWHGHASYGKVLHPTQQLPSQAKFTGPWPLRRRHRSHHCVIAVALASPARRGARRARCSPAAARQRAPPARRPCR